ncbi:MAG TPA: aldehyde reductase [Galbitalea sp.]|jgi:dihydroflavonol-4-reductase|nr:aldehyde reductase [Galbitalea sp.]
MSGETVLVTGGSGFVGAHCILQLLNAGYTVRTSVRSLSREPAVRATLKNAGAKSVDRLSFIAADLLSDDGWADAVKGCTYVLHVASPFPATQPRNEDDLIIPAREGALRVLRAARDAKVKRVVLTSSFAAVGYSAPPEGRPFDETDWTNPNDKVTAYVKSKTLAERAAWDFIQSEGGGLELSVINPVGILGPALSKEVSTSIDLAIRLLNGDMPGMPQISFGIVDVRDVAGAHLLAMTNPKAVGERFLAIAGPAMSIPAVAVVLRDNLGDAAKHVPTRVLPNWVVRALSVAVPALRENLSQLGKPKQASNAKAKKVLGWKPRTNEEAILATAHSLIDLGLAKP